MVKATYAGEAERNNTKGLLFNLKFTGNYGAGGGAAGVGDLVDLTPGAVADPTLSYNMILEQPPTNIAVLNENLGGSYINLVPNAVPTLQNLGVVVYEPGGAEKGRGVAYTAAELAGSAAIEVFVPLQ